MAFGLYALLEASVLILNAICILHEQRFLAKFGWGSDAYQFGTDNSMKSRLLTFITSVRTVMRSKILIHTVSLFSFSPPHRCKYSTYCIQTNTGITVITAELHHHSLYNACS
ncbi:unnamed protein product [Hymenolepis diminuta]|uniref:Immediate early response 3-interacting protein 1 n=1 Tax=Hymenolepis diminuta TaxID=6216 RepID=A0A0R3SWK8_HYMDI|nr:unnamed protein product [Hymenolepis diminuta]